MASSIPSKQDYTVSLVKHLLSVGILRILDGHLVSSRKLIDHAAFFETEDIICREWLHSVYDSYYFYDGFNTLEQCEQHIFKGKYEPHTYIIVEFLGMFYAVCYENTQNQQIIGNKYTYFTKNKLFLVSDHLPLNLMVKQKERLPVVSTIYHELLCFDENMKAYRLPTHDSSSFVLVEETQETLPYFVLLGVTFKDCWYPCHTPFAIAHSRAALNMYFNEGHDFTLFGKYANALAINPFQHLICYPKGRIEHFQMDVDDRKTPLRKLPYREAKRFQHLTRIRPIKDHENMAELI